MAYAVQIPETGTPEVLQRIETDIPDVPAGMVRIRNHATAVNFIDTILRRGEMPDGMMPSLPHTPGVEGAGVIDAVGDGVLGLEPGDGVAGRGPLGAGGYGSHSVISAPCVTKITGSVAFETAASIPVNAMTAWHMLVNLGRAKAGDTVLVHAAAGGVGTMALQIARHLGVQTIASVSTGKQDYALAQGATHVVDYRTEDLPKRVAEITRGGGVNLTLNPISGAKFHQDLEMLAPLGTAVVFGFLAGPPQGDFATDLTQHFQKSIAVRVSDIYTYFGTDPAGFHADLGAVFQLLTDGILTPQTTVLPITEAAEAHRRLEAGSTMGKLVLTLD